MRTYLLAIAALIGGLSASANPFDVAEKMKLHPDANSDFKAIEVTNVIKPEKVASRAEDDSEQVYYTLAGEPSTTLLYNNQNPGMQVAMAFQLEPSFIATLTDGQITEISYYTGTQTDENVNKITQATVFIANALDGTYLYTQETTAPETAFTKVDVKLNEPFTIPTDKKVFVGVYFKLNSANNASIVVDEKSHSNDKGGWVGFRASSFAKWTWNNIASNYGFVTLGAKIKSSTFPKNSVSLLAIDGQPVVAVNEAFPFSFLMQNNGANNITEITLEYGIEGEPAATAVLSVEGEWGINQSIVASVNEFTATVPTKKSKVNVAVTAINGEPNTAADPSGSYPITVVPAGTSIPQNVVIEEFTSISCVYCPVGYTAMEQIHAETDGSVIPVCVHVNMPGSDPMTAMSFGNVVNNYCTDGVPSSTINRTYSMYPTYDYLMSLIPSLKALPGVASVSAEAKLDKDSRTLTVDTETSFAFDYTDGDKNFVLAYAVTENQVGPYTQKNGYSGSTSQVPGGWQKKPGTVSLIYNDVARQLDTYKGITGSVPAQITAGEVYKYSHDVKLVQAINNLDNINVVVYLLNLTDGSIANACLIKSATYGEAGVEAVVADNENAPVEYYNLQGIRIANPSNGVFIRRQGNKVTKVLK